MTPKEKMNIVIGQLVHWRCNPYSWESFIAEGIVRKISKASLGNVRFNIGSVQVEPLGQYRKVFPRRKKTTIAIHNLILTP